MNPESILKKIFFGQLVSVLGILVLLFNLSSAQASSLYLYEVFGALMASMLTVFGLLKMSQMTS